MLQYDEKSLNNLSLRESNKLNTWNPSIEQKLSHQYPDTYTYLLANSITKFLMQLDFNCMLPKQSRL